MNFLISASTDVGTTKSTNQDSLSVKVTNTKQGRMVFAIVCDGLGGLKKGEVASASVVNAFNLWFINDLPVLSDSPIDDSVIKAQWTEIINVMNNKIVNYGKQIGIELGTTVVAMLLTEKRYYIINVGDSRAYEISSHLSQITKDQTLVAREVEQGIMTKEQALIDPRRNILLQCVGATGEVYPEMFFGDTICNAVYMLCSDGFVHEITQDEIYSGLNPEILCEDQVMKNNMDRLIELNKQRQEKDNISVTVIRTF